MLTQAQREYLRGEKEYKQSVEAEVQRRIRNRVRASVADLNELVEAGAAGDIDLAEALEVGDQRPPMWALPALLFLWTENNKIASRQLFSAGDSPSEDDIERRTGKFDMEVCRGIEAVFDFAPPEGVVYGVENELTIDIGPPPEEIPQDDIAALPQSVLSALLRRGQLSEQEYGEIMKERFERVESGDIDPRPPVGNVSPEDLEKAGDLDAYLDRAVQQRETDANETGTGAEDVIQEMVDDDRDE